MLQEALLALIAFANDNAEDVLLDDTDAGEENMQRIFDYAEIVERALSSGRLICK